MGFEEWLKCQNPDELFEIELRELTGVVMEIAKSRGKMILTEANSPELIPKNDKILMRLREYALKGEYPWSSEKGKSQDIAELVEELEALKKRGSPEANPQFLYLVGLLELVESKEDMDAGSFVCDSLKPDEQDVDRLCSFEMILDGYRKGWEDGLTRGVKMGKALDGDSLIGAKLYANAGLSVDRFIHPAENNISDE